MGGHWQILNVDRKEKKVSGGRKVKEIFRTDMSALYKSLRIPCLPKDVDRWLAHGPVVVQRKEIARLSAEILDMIFRKILHDPEDYPGYNFIDCVSLALSCKQFLYVGQRHVLRSLVSFHGRAADCRLVCLGESAGPDDQAPSGMLTDAELKEIADPDVPKVLPKGPFHNEEKEYEPVEATRPRCLYSFASAQYKPSDRVLDKLQRPLRNLCVDMHKREKREGPVIDPRLAFDKHMVTVLGCAQYFPCPVYPDGPNALCNMSKGEYVLEDKLVALESLQGKIDLGHALLSRIFYSPGSNVPWAFGGDSEYDDQLAKGPWAGDRFRIAPANGLPELEDGKEWKDVTEEANKLLCHLWSVHDIAGDDYDTDSDVWDGEETVELTGGQQVGNTLSAILEYV
ncbi:hypothetical protein GSI_01281 [Ganoderma sinense ZZ0214-1]|uniref:Uncharacterized protein n=1 Tax=Ganoderma sinense ZZ0214-1 TaxID=1077348 RepID=A0A2G8SUZ7_9APHY|nr:hypothetical protein GSI_01281 [Ganoderma sinense ZZ0214-1]